MIPTVDLSLYKMEPVEGTEEAALEALKAALDLILSTLDQVESV